MENVQNKKINPQNLKYSIYMNCFLSIAEETKNWKLDEDSTLFLKGERTKILLEQMWSNRGQTNGVFFVKIRIGGVIFARLESKRVKDMRLHKNSNT